MLSDEPNCHLMDDCCKSVIFGPIFFEQVSSLWWYSPSSARWCSWFATCSATRGPTTPMRQRERSRPSPLMRPSSGRSRPSQRPLRKARRNGLSEKPLQAAPAQSPCRWFRISLSVRTRQRGGEGGWGFKLSYSEILYTVHSDWLVSDFYCVWGFEDTVFVLCTDLPIPSCSE